MANSSVSVKGLPAALSQCGWGVCGERALNSVTGGWVERRQASKYLRACQATHRPQPEAFQEQRMAEGARGLKAELCSRRTC